MHQHGYLIRKAIEDAAARTNQRVVTSGTGTAFHVHFGLDQVPQSYRDVMHVDKDTGNKFRSALFESGIYTLPNGRWYVGATHAEEQLAQVLSAIDKAMVSL